MLHASGHVTNLSNRGVSLPRSMVDTRRSSAIVPLAGLRASVFNSARTSPRRPAPTSRSNRFASSRQAPRSSGKCRCGGSAHVPRPASDHRVTVCEAEAIQDDGRDILPACGWELFTILEAMSRTSVRGAATSGGSSAFETPVGRRITANHFKAGPLRPRSLRAIRRVDMLAGDGATRAGRVESDTAWNEHHQIGSSARLGMA